jgi:hypothetical protein
MPLMQVAGLSAQTAQRLSLMSSLLFTDVPFDGLD